MSQLGFIPSWQFNPDPRKNPLINAYTIPLAANTAAGPVFSTVPPADRQSAGLGFLMVDHNVLNQRVSPLRGAHLRGAASGPGLALGLLLGVAAVVYVMLAPNKS